MYSFNKICSNILPAGTYKMQVTDIKYHSPDKAARDMDINLTVISGAYEKRTLRDFMSEKAFSFRLKPFLTACGVDLNREFDTEDQLYKYAMSECTGKTVMVTVGTREYNGNEYNNVSQYAALTGSTASMEDVAAVFGDAPSLSAKKDEVEVEKVWKKVAEELKNDDGSDSDIPF